MQLECADRRLDLASPIVMGVLNVTPDSFSDGGRFLDPAAAYEQAARMLEEGAAIIDVGGESTRPRALEVDTAEELRRVLPVLERVLRLNVVVSVDTGNPEVMRQALACGAHMINDVRALQRPGALEALSCSRAAVCLVHMRGEPASMQAEPHYDDVLAEVRAFLEARVQACERAGISRSRLCLDPGFGFGKLAAHNLMLLRRLGELRTLGLPLLVGLSRKSLLHTLTGRPLQQRLAGSTALAAIAALHGASIVRAHEVAATVDALKVASAVA
jgi:dihydropteroate synthase